MCVVVQKHGPPPKERGHDEVTISTLTSGGEAKTFKLHKGIGCLSKAPMVSIIPEYIKTLTNPYELDFSWWECIECIRKVTMGGLFMFFAPGSPYQLMGGILAVVLFAVAYNNISPYDILLNDWLQQWCQIVLFITLISVLSLRIFIAQA